MKGTKISPQSRAASQPYYRSKPSPREKLVVGDKLPKVEEQKALQNQLFAGSDMTIAQIVKLSHAEGKAQTETAKLRTAHANRKRRALPQPPPAITQEQRARGRLLRYIALYEDEYREEILEYMYKMQECTMPSRTAMEQQTDIGLHMRPSLLDFMVELHNVFHLRQETLYLGVNILDRYCSRRVVHKKHYQLVGCTALWIAAKYEDSKDHVPGTGDLKQYCRGVYEEGSFMQMEQHVLNTVEWELGHPTAEAWLRCMVNTLDRSGSKAAKEMAIRQGWVGLPELETRGVPVIMADLSTQCIARYLMEVMIYQDGLIDVPPCVIAEAALILSKVINWKTRERRNESVAALHVAKFLHDQLSRDVNCISTTLYNKYKSPQFERASAQVTQFYLSTNANVENCLKFLEELPDVEEVAEAKEAEEAERAAEEAEMEEIDVRCEGPKAESISFCDSGYGSVVGEGFIAGSAESSPAGSTSNASAVGNSPLSPSSSSSPHKASSLPAGVPPLRLPISPAPSSA